MTPEAKHTLDAVTKLRRAASIAQIGGFRPPDSPVTSWFGKGVGLPGQSPPEHNGKPMFPLIQINTGELPAKPPGFPESEMLVLFMNSESLPFDRPHGDGWEIREYESVSGLVPLPDDLSLPGLNPFPIQWQKIVDDLPGWEDCWSLLDLSAVNSDSEASNEFFEIDSRYSRTKVGGYPHDIQHGVGLDDYLFQVGTEPKANWMWADNGIGYFFRSAEGEWRWSCQFY